MKKSNQFGAFFREIREGLGLSLREFCRRTGFDQANVSRLERGLLPPPKSQKVLTSYAKGLRLKPKFPEWDRFMALAKPPAEPRRGQGHKNWVTARHLDDWAGTLEARSLLPQLVRRLIRATGTGLVRVEAPAGEQTQRTGWDGLVEASGEAEFVPKGVSAWEMGVEKDPKAKAEEDFAKRQKKSPGLVKRKSTFVFITPRKWQKKGAWVEEKTKLKSWKEIRVYDSASLEEWLESAPAVDIWLARQLGICPPGLIDVDEYWKDLKALTDPSFDAGVYLASRGKEFEQLKEWLNGPADTLVIESRSPSEALDFVVAASRKPELGEAFAARAVIVERRDAWRSLAGSDSGLILVVHPGLAIEAELTAEAVRKGHHVVVCASGPSLAQCRRIELPRVSGLALQQALVTQGVSHARAADLATIAGGSITVLKRRTARHPGTVHPEWSRQPNARAVVPLLLAGQWSDSSEGDRRALEKLAEAPYSEVVELAERWAASPEPMLRRGPSRWELVSRDDSWALVSYALGDEDLRRFERVALEVLGELDPACELPSDERWKANVLGKVRTHSTTLQTGLAESLALLGARPPEKKGSSMDPRGLATYLVRSHLDGKDWRVWGSLSSVLPLLAEASPDAFLAAFEKDLGKGPPAVVNLFDQDSSPIFGSSLHTGLLFALEGLAWDRNSLPRVTQLLAQLDEVAPPTKLGNSPMRTLTQIFMPWYPQTTAPVEDRVRILQSVARRHPKAGRKLLLALLPTSHSAVSTNARPSFRNWTLDWSEGATRADYAFQVEACADLVVELAGTDVARLKDAVEAFENLPLSARTKLLDQIASIAPDTLKTDDLRTLAEAIREKVNRHRQFVAADWALKETVLGQLDRLRERLEPGDVVAKNAWLFSDYWKVRSQFERYGGDEEEVEDADKTVERVRTHAIDEIRTAKGWDGLLELAGVATSPDQVGCAVAAAVAEGDDARVLPQLLTDARKGIAEFAKGFVRVRQHRQGWAWVKALPRDQWSDEQIVEFTLALPCEHNAWDISATRGPKVEEQYWKKVLQYCYVKNSEDVIRACSMFGKVGRAFDAVRQLSMARHRDVKVDPSVIIQVLQQGRDALSDPDQHTHVRQVDYDIKVFIQDLQNLVDAGDSRVEANVVANLEWTYLDLLDGHPTNPKILHRWLAEEPQFLIELLRIVFRRADEKEARPEPSESDRARAMQVYRLLNSWDRVPGTKADGSVDEELLRRWIESVQRLAEKDGRREVADIRIGNVFAYAPANPDGTWPCIPVRDAIEEFGTDDLADGFEVAIMNKRGAYMKAPDEGGTQERGFAKQFFDWADALQIEWPKTAASLRHVGERYEAYARREDAEAEIR
jgi:transcriptional regulator with XRE-family HTH domain